MPSNFQPFIFVSKFGNDFNIDSKCFDCMWCFCILCPVVPPVINSETQQYLAPLDSSVTLQCQADGFPLPSVTWHKDGQSLIESVRQRVLSSGSLQIAFIQPSDTGRYTCTAANAAGTVNLEMSLTVQSRFKHWTALNILYVFYV